jgi:hypothetical protein
VVGEKHGEAFITQFEFAPGVDRRRPHSARRIRYSSP